MRLVPRSSRPHAALAALALVSLLLVPAVAAARGVREVTLLTITDFHGALSGGGRERDTNRMWGGAVAVAELVRRERGLRPDRTFLFDIGDEMQGTPESNLVFGRSTVRVLNELGTDAAALGNHDFDWGIDSLRARERDMHYPMLAANVFEKRTGRRPEWARPYAIVRRDGVRIGVIGFATPETPRVTLPQNVASLRFAPPESLLSGLVGQVRRRADLVVLLCHLGGEQGADGAIRGEIADLARGARGVDAILGGHTHTFVAGEVAGIPVVVAGSSGRLLGRIVLRWDGVRVVGAEERLLRAYSDSLQVPAWDPIAAYVDSVRAQVRPIVERVLGRAARPLRQAALANLVTDAMRSAVHADVAIANPGGLRRDLDAGPITMGNLFELLPFENSLVVVSLTGAQLRAVIASRPEKALLSGLGGRWNPAAAADSQLVLLQGDGTALLADSTYRVVTNNFLAQGGDGFRGFDTGRDLTLSPLLVRDVVVEAIEAETRAGRQIDPDPKPRLQLPAAARR